MSQQEARTDRFFASCKHRSDLLFHFTVSSNLMAVLCNSGINERFSLLCRKPTSWRMRNPACRTILLIFWKRRNGWSSFWLPTSPSAKSPHRWIQTFLWSPCLRCMPASPPLSPRSHRPPSQRQPLSLQAIQHSPQPLTPSSAAAATPSCQRPPSPTAWWKWLTWIRPFWRSRWTSWQRRRQRRRGLSPMSTCPTPSSPLRTGSLFTPQSAAVTLSPCARPWWPARRPAPPWHHLSCSPFQRRRPSPPAVLPTGDEATATTSLLIHSAPLPC